MWIRSYTNAWTAWVEKGATGPKGDKGDKGDKGNTGPVGPTGPSNVQDKNPQLTWSAQATVATINGTAIHVRMPSNPNTDTNTAHTHSKGDGLTISGSGGTSGDVKYSIDLNYFNDRYVSKGGATMTGPLIVYNKKMNTSPGYISDFTSNNQAGIFSDGIGISSPAIRTDSGWLRVLGTGESDTVVELGAGDDSGAGETIQFNYYNTSGAIVHSVAVPKDSGTVALTKNIPAVNNPTITLTQNGATKGSFTLNQSGNATINFTDKYNIYVSGTTLYIEEV